ncbi:hypothetical protein P389DRAFT_57088 [Cystobasidium minutum MCA 4210]|uniref:uncharacterized protein n=1 Tax=Cystobasidium minutum MCA 4210 TaxID=1397322 RepID=UPI0034CE5810|eukprot:jgi/Rhomi1/57088/CE57087_1705
MAVAPTLARPSSAMASSFTATTSIKASKTWVLPPRPKPGRKSKKDLAAAAAAAASAPAAKVDDKDDDEEVEEAEKAINRTKQKASRERKQEYIAELEAKVRTYEQGDGERASFFQGLAKTYSEENAALKRENEELRTRLALYESGQVPSGSSTPRNNASSPATAQSPAPPLTRKASQDLAASTSSAASYGRGSKRQRTKSISSNASSSSATPHYATASTSGASGSGTSTISLASALSHSTAATSMTAGSYHAARSPAAIVIPSPSMSVSMGMHTTPSPAASSSSYIPPSPPVSLGVSPKHAHSAGCGLCDSNTGVSCICSDIGLREGGAKRTLDLHAEEEDEEEPNFEDLNLIPSSSRMSEMDRCGFCTESTSGACLCAEAGLRKINTYTTSLPQSMSNNISNRREDEDKLAPLPPSRIAIARTPSSAASSSGIPPGSASVRLRLPKRGIAAGQIWRIDTSQAQVPQQLTRQQEQVMIPVQQRHPAAAAGVALRRKLIKVGSRLPCSGDPKTCLACADDPAGQAFCSALSNSVCANGNCTNCPNRPSPLSNEVTAAAPSTSSNPSTRQASPYTVPSPTTGDAFSSSAASTSHSMPSIRRRDSSARDEIPHAMIPCSDAWATLREHPNIGYANLDMLASVVAKRTQCMMDEKRDKDGKIVEVEQQGVEEALDLLDHMRDVEVVKAKLDAIPAAADVKMGA